MKKRTPTADIGTELDTYIRTSVMHESGTKENLKKFKKEITEIVKSHFPTKTHQTFVELWVVDSDFHCLIGFRRFDAPKFGFINCKVGMTGVQAAGVDGQA